ncbi:MAG: arginine deiminase family protein [Proteobacteria bacterium]|jgi:dimethylargininase|nr:arginine deiminase family protein [Pseudomonadota bacterium]
MMYGVSSMTAPLRKVAVMRPGESLKNADPEIWHYGPLFNPKKIEDVHRNFIYALEASGAEIYWIPGNDSGIADAVFTYDASLMTPSGAVLMSPGKLLRSGEQDLHRRFYESQNIPIIGAIEGIATADAGDTLWLDDNTLLVGRGYRTNQAGVDQLRAIMTNLDVNVHVFDLPHYHGAGACLHLMSLISLVDTHTALVCLRLLPVGLWELLKFKGFLIIEAPFSEFEESNTLSTNVLATRPGDCIMLENLPKTREALSSAGIKVKVFDGAALCIGCEGGPTCLTRPLLRC